MRRLLPLKFLALVLLSACVTVNVYFPAAAAEQAADRIIDAVTAQPGGAKPKEPESSTTPQTPPNSRLTPDGGIGTQRSGFRLDGSQSEGGSPQRESQPSEAHAAGSRPSESQPLLAAAGALLDLLIPVAEAQAAPNLDISDPQIRAVTGSMQQRFGELKKYFDSGVIGLTQDGQVAIRDPNAIALSERATVSRLVAEDNRDRATLYAELARANKHPEWEPDIRRTFARRWVERGAQPGWYYQDVGGNWVRK